MVQLEFEHTTGMTGSAVANFQNKAAKASSKRKQGVNHDAQLFQYLNGGVHSVFATVLV